MKKLIWIVLLVVSVVALSACDKNVNTDLTAPTNLDITEGVLTWDAVKGVDGYIVYVNDDEYETIQTTYDLTTLDLSDGSYYVSVVSKVGDEISIPSNVLTYVVGEEEPTIDAPTNVVIADGVVTWSAVDGALGYFVHVGELTFEVSGLSIDLTTKSIPEGVHSVYVVASSATELSSNSSSVSYEVIVSTAQDNIVALILDDIDSSYQVGMTEDDFMYPDDYEDYLDAVRSANAYAEASLLAGLTEAEAVSMFGDAAGVAQSMGQAQSASQMMLQMEFYQDYDMTAAEMAIILYHIVVTQLEIGIEHNEAMILAEEAYIESIEAEIADIKATTDYQEAYTYMSSFATVDQMDALDALFNADYYTFKYLIGDIQNAFLYSNTFDPYEYDYDMYELDAYAYDLYGIAAEMYLDTTGQTYVENLTTNLYFMNSLYNYQDQIHETEDWIDGMYSDLAFMEPTLDTLETNAEDIKDSIAIVLEFLITLDETMPTDSILLIDQMLSGTELSLTEILTIKDEMTAMLQNALPEATDFETLYETLWLIAGNYTGQDVSGDLMYASINGQITYYSIDLLLTFVADVDESLILGGQAILDQAYNELDESYDFESNPKVIIDFGLYVADYIVDFKTAYDTELAALNLLVSDDYLEYYYILVLDALIHEAEMNAPVEEQEMIVGILEDLKLEFDTYKALIDLFKDEVVDVVSYVYDTEALLLKTIIDMQNDDGTDLAITLDMVDILINEGNMLDQTLMANLTESNLGVILDALKLPLSIAVEQSGLEVDFDVVYEALKPSIIQVLLNVIDLELDIVDEIDLLDLDVYLLNPNVTPDVAVVLALGDALDQAIDLSNALMIVATINIVFDDILGNTEIVGLIPMTEAEIDLMQADVILEANNILDMITDIAGMDINNLTQADIDLINQVLMMFQGPEPQ